jgi:hypothetical protein
MSNAGLTIKQAQLVQRKNLENIVRKVSEGKVLSRQEFEMLDSIASAQTDDPDTQKVRSWTALAKVLGVSRKTVWDLRDKHNGPQTMDVADWREFLERRASESPHWQNEDQQSEEVRELRTKLLRAQAGKEDAMRKLRELEYARAQAGLVPMSEARSSIKKVMAPLRALLDALPKSIAVQANPTDPNQAERAAREGLQKVFGMMEGELEKIENASN